LASCLSEESITISDVIEYLFCSRFTYFIHCLGIPQREGRLIKVQKGRTLHRSKEKTNIGYLRKRYGVTDKLTGIYLCSRKYRIRGIMDEVLFLDDGSAAPLDYKFAKYRNRVFKTHKYQSALYGLMVAEHFNLPVYRGYLCYTRSRNKIVEIAFNEKLLQQAKDIIRNIFNIIQKEQFPETTENKKRCIDCCYRRICPH
jgi:CRISPR-associated exonuclease Cas4